MPHLPLRRLVSAARPACEDMLQVHHLRRYELGDGEGDTSAAPSMSATTRRASAAVRPPRSAPSPSWISRVDRVDVKVDGHLRGAGSPSQSSSGALVDRSASGLNTLRPHSSAIAGSVGSVQSCMPTSATRSAVVVAGSTSRTSWSP